MSKTQLQAVYSYEENFQAAIKTLIAAETTAIQVLRFGDEATLVKPRIEIATEYQGVDMVDRSLDDQGRLYFRKHNLQVRIQLFDTPTARTQHLTRCGLMRALLSYQLKELVQPLLPFYQIQNIFEQGGQSGVSSADDDELTTVLTFLIHFLIPPTAFNADEEDEGEPEE